MFCNCNTLVKLDLGSFDTSKVTDMSNMFDNCNSLRRLNVASFDTTNVTDMSNMFRKCIIQSLDLRSFDTTAANTTNAFAGCKWLTKVALGPKTILNCDCPRKSWKRTSDLEGNNLSGPTIINLSYYDGTCPGWYETKISPKAKIIKAYTYRVKKGKTQVVIKASYPKKEVDTFLIKIARNKKFTKSVKTVRADKYMLRKGKIGVYGKLKKGKTYFIKVRAIACGPRDYYGPWSNVKKIKGR